jgi:hypothetical protein
VEDILHHSKAAQTTGGGGKTQVAAVDLDGENVVEEGEDYVSSQTRERDGQGTAR